CRIVSARLVAARRAADRANRERQRVAAGAVLAVDDPPERAGERHASAEVALARAAVLGGVGLLLAVRRVAVLRVGVGPLVVVDRGNREAALARVHAPAAARCLAGRLRYDVDPRPLARLAAAS